MSKKIFLIALCAMMMAAIALPILCAEEDPAVIAKRAAAIEKAKQTLASKEWIIYITVKPATEKTRAVMETDVLTFGDGTVKSKNLSVQGYATGGSNYSIWMDNDGTAIWETMQMHENEKDISFLRGELRGSVMTGSVIMKPQRGDIKIYPYTSVASK